MISFGANIVNERRYMPTFKIQDQIHHRIIRPLLLRTEDPQYLQMYFFGVREENQTDVKRNFNEGTRIIKIRNLHEWLCTNNT